MEVLKKYIYQVRGVSYKPSDVCDNEKGVPILRAGNICDNRICLDDIVCVDSSKIRSEQFLRDGDVLICASSGSKSVVGKAAIYKLNNFISAFGAFCKVVRIKEDENVLADFIRLYFSSKFYREQISNKSQGANINNIKAEDIDSLLINIPDIQTQNIAVSELDKIQAALDNKKDQLKKLDELIQSKFYEMFGDPVVNDKGWDIKELGEICELKAGKNIKASELYEIQSDGLYPCYGGNGLRGYINKYSHQGTFSLIGRQGALCGNVKLAKGLFYATEHAVVVTPRIEINALYVYYVLTFLELNRYAKGVAQPGISVQVINGVYFPLPPLPLQQAFAAYVEKVEQAKAIVNQEIAHLQELLNSRMDYYFRK